jgi:CDP-diacylglycerol--glycerol-3-phosphate 3-phosphatidyltransferase
MLTALLGLVGAFLTSYTRARAEALGLDAKVGLLQRPERVVLLSAPQALFGLVFGGWVLAIIIVILTVTAWITVIQRVAFVYTATTRPDAASARVDGEARPRFFARRRAARPLLKGD